jgi:F-type H+-transporting ATPase subunit b
MSGYYIVIIVASWTDWLNYPGLELWKFANLFIFLGVAVLVVRRPLGEALRARREAIKQELVKAQTEREQAQLSLDEAEKLLARAAADVNELKEQAKREASQERQRLLEAAEEEIRKLEMQAKREIEMAHKVALKELREFLAKRSVELASQTIRSQMRPEDDVRLINSSLDELRRSRI